jgi:hypothetical protein
VSNNDALDGQNAESRRTDSLADELIGLTEPEVMALVDTDTPPGYRIHVIEEGTDNGLRLHDMDARRMYLFTRSGKVVRHESGS